MRSRIDGAVIRQLSTVGLASLLVCLATSARAQGIGTLRGVVVDSASRAPVPAAEVSALVPHLVTRTDDQGRFTLVGIPSGRIELSIRRLGYEPQHETLVATGGPRDSILVVLVARAEELSAVSAAARRQREGVAGFYARRAHGIGAFVTREDLEARHARVPTDALNMPGIALTHTRYGTSVRFTTRSTLRRDCPPMLWLDGQRAPGMELDEIPVNDIEAIELYQGPSVTPAQFWLGNTNNTACGTIVVWSRSPGM